MPSHTGSQISGYCTQLVIDDGVSGARKDREDQALGNEFCRKKESQSEGGAETSRFTKPCGEGGEGRLNLFEKDDRLPERKTKEPPYQVDP